MVETFDLEVVKYGDSTVVTLPRRVREKTGIKPGDYIRISIQRMKLVPVPENKKSRDPPSRKVTGDLPKQRVPVTFRGKGTIVGAPS